MNLNLKIRINKHKNESKGRKAIAFGSYGWGGQSIPQISEYFNDSGFDIIESIKVKYIPGEEILDKLKKDLMEKMIS